MRQYWWQGTVFHIYRWDQSDSIRPGSMHGLCDLWCRCTQRIMVSDFAEDTKARATHAVLNISRNGFFLLPSRILIVLIPTWNIRVIATDPVLDNRCSLQFIFNFKWQDNEAHVHGSIGNNLLQFQRPFIHSFIHSFAFNPLFVEEYFASLHRATRTTNYWPISRFANPAWLHWKN